MFDTGVGTPSVITEVIKVGSLWYRNDDREKSVYLLSQLGIGEYALTALSASGSSWSGCHKFDHSLPLRRELTVEEWAAVRVGRPFEYLGDMANITADLLLAPTWEDECRELMWDNKKVAAIQTMRRATGKGLKESKDYVEAHFPMSRESRPEAR